MLTLGFDTSNYATSLAVFDTLAGEVVCDCKRFLPVRAGQLGLRQSDAVFHHTAALPAMIQELGEKADLTRVEAVGVSARPRPVDGSYMPCFLVGLSAATAFCAARRLPLVQTTHQQGHLAAAMFAAKGTALFGRELLVFHVSGGTTDLLHLTAEGQISCLGTSTDLYAGQAVDRLGVRLGFAFPAGAEVSACAAICAEEVRPRASVRGFQCSLSGLQNQCERLLAEGKSAPYVCKYCLLSVAKTLYLMAQAVLGEYPGLPIVFAGGVMSSELVQEYLRARLPQALFVPGKYASDNAIGVALLAAREVEAWPIISG